MDEIRIGLVGLGGRGLSWLRLLHAVPGFRVTALCDPIAALHEPALVALKERVPAYTRYEDVLADPQVEAVALCVRCKEQGALAAQALDAGKHVNSEVPAAHTLEDCWRIALAAERSGKVYSLGEQTRYWGFVEAWQQLVAEGKLGRVTFVEGQYIGYYGTRQFFQDPTSGAFASVEDLPARPGAKPTWLHTMPPIHYLPHELSPLLKVLDDRVVEVTAMSTGAPSYAHPEIGQPDIQVALMKTEKDALLRLATGFTQPVPHARGHHWYQVLGTKGCVEWKRAGRGRPLLWTVDSQMHDLAEVDWHYERTDAPHGATGSGHGDADYYVHAAFRDAVLGVRPLEFDVYRALDTAVPAILAADSIAQGTQLLKAPDFRPNAQRAVGQLPNEVA
ncbi:MAG: Gfo/Idh/MocA family oxidoreductase [candidate division Zixibacteria bacterium]|nr:Gfo/Idh/MocA family oxidoreductase [candidate division Zixibacteria bacterium]